MEEMRSVIRTAGHQKLELTSRGRPGMLHCQIVFRQKFRAEPLSISHAPQLQVILDICTKDQNMMEQMQLMNVQGSIIHKQLFLGGSIKKKLHKVVLQTKKQIQIEQGYRNCFTQSCLRASVLHLGKEHH
jgi:hypothetical protein